MIDLKELTLLDLLPSSIGDNREIRALANALTNELQNITESINEVLLLPRIDELSEEVVDSLAGQFHIDFYEPLGLDLDKKRELVKNSLKWHQRKGTKSVLIEVIKILFFQDFKIEEWYEYGSSPFYFRILVNDIIESKNRYDELIAAIHELKNVRSWLETIRFHQEAETTIYSGIAIKHIRKNIVNSDKMLYQDVNVALNTGIAIKHVRRNTILCQGGDTIDI